MNNRQLLYKKINCLRLEVDESIVNDILETMDKIFSYSEDSSIKLEEITEYFKEKQWFNSEGSTGLFLLSNADISIFLSDHQFIKK